MFHIFKLISAEGEYQKQVHYSNLNPKIKPKQNSILHGNIKALFSILKFLFSSDHCEEIRASLSKQIGIFYTCSFQHAHASQNYSLPSKKYFCQSCVRPFNETRNLYMDLKNATNQLTTNESCESIYFNREKLNVVQRTYDEAVHVWNIGSCSGWSAYKYLFSFLTDRFPADIDCFTFVNDTFVTSEWTDQFINYTKKHHHCIGLHTDQECDNCKHTYVNLKVLYNKRFAQQNAICSDIIEMVSN